MQIQQIKLSKMETFCYIVFDEETKTCGLIDPAFDCKNILNQVNIKGYKITHVINTHCHFDHTAGNAYIINKTSAKLLIHALDAKKLTGIINNIGSRILGGKKSYKPDILLKDNDLIDIGKTQLKVIHTPGHTKGGICLYADKNLITGDTLFIGSVGRTDLPGGSSKQLLKSIIEKLYTLPDDTKVWPGHDYGQAPYSTVGQEKLTNIFTT